MRWPSSGRRSSKAALGYWVGLVYLGDRRVRRRLLRSTIGSSARIGPAQAAYSSVLIPILAMAISTVAEGYRWSALAIGGGVLALAGLVIALRAGRLPAPALPPGD